MRDVAHWTRHRGGTDNGDITMNTPAITKSAGPIGSFKAGRTLRARTSTSAARPTAYPPLTSVIANVRSPVFSDDALWLGPEIGADMSGRSIPLAVPARDVRAALVEPLEVGFRVEDRAPQHQDDASLVLSAGPILELGKILEAL